MLEVRVAEESFIAYAPDAEAIRNWAQVWLHGTEEGKSSGSVTERAYHGRAEGGSKLEPTRALRREPRPVVRVRLQKQHSDEEVRHENEHAAQYSRLRSTIAHAHSPAAGIIAFVAGDRSNNEAECK